MINYGWLEIDTPLARRIDSSLLNLFAAVRKAAKIIPLWRVSDKAFHN